MNLLAARYIDRWAGVAVHLGLHAVGRATGRRLPPPGATTPPSAGRTWARPRRVLAIKFYGLGNLVMILPTLAALRAAVPEVEIDFLTLPGNEALLEQSGLMARVLTVEVATFPRFARAVARLVQALRARGYDTVLDFERFAAVADALAERHGVVVAFTGQGAAECALVAEATRRMRHPALDACDRLGVGELAALVAEATVVLTGDTSVMHLAGAVGTPVVALLGPTPPALYGPRGSRDVVFYKDLYCSPCLSNYNFKMITCTDPVCMRSIVADELLAAIVERFFPSGAQARRVGG